MQNDTPRLLLVEDNPADVDLLKFGLDEHEVDCEIFVASDGREALNFLNREEPYVSAFRPDFIVLDISIPEVSGIQVLEYIKSTESLRTIPVMMLTSSSLKQDIENCRRHLADSYIIKPNSIDEYGDIALTIQSYWQSSTALPTQWENI